MQTYNATYTSNGHAQAAAVTLQKNKVAIAFATPNGNRVVYWQYAHIVANNANAALFSYTDYPPQSLELLDRSLAETLQARMATGKKTALHLRNQTALVLVAGLLALFAAVYFLVLPWVATRLAANVPVAYEKKLGDEMYAALAQGFQIDERRSVYATQFFDALHIPSKYPITITVVNDAVANAFALPGGHIVIYTGLLNQLTAYPQLAALLGHEVTHIAKRHSLKTVFRQASTTLLFSTLVGDAGAVGAVVLNSADNLKRLSYSRSLEREADAEGVRLLAARKIDVAGFVQLFNILENEPGNTQPEWVSSHPQLKNRIAAIRASSAFKTRQPVVDSALRLLFLKLKTAD